MMLEKQIVSNVFIFFRKVEADHKSPATKLLNFLNTYEFSHNICTHLSSICQKIFLFHDLQYRETCSASKVITAEGCTQHSRPGFNITVNQHAAYRETIAHTFCHGNQMRLHTSILMRKEFSSPSVARLNFIQNQKRIVSQTFAFKKLEKRIFGKLYTADTLNAFDNNRRHMIIEHV